MTSIPDQQPRLGSKPPAQTTTWIPIVLADNRRQGCRCWCRSRIETPMSGDTPSPMMTISLATVSQDCFGVWSCDALTRHGYSDTGLEKLGIFLPRSGWDRCVVSQVFVLGICIRIVPFRWRRGALNQEISNIKLNTYWTPFSNAYLYLIVYLVPRVFDYLLYASPNVWSPEIVYSRYVLNKGMHGMARFERPKNQVRILWSSDRQNNAYSHKSLNRIRLYSRKDIIHSAG